MPARHANQTQLDRELGALTSEREVFGLFLELQGAGVIAGPVQNEARVSACPQLLSRGFFEEVTTDSTGTHQYPGMVLKMARTPNHIRWGSPKLGEHNEYVYRELLGYSEEEYGAFEAAGQVGEGYAPGVAAPPA